MQASRTPEEKAKHYVALVEALVAMKAAGKPTSQKDCYVVRVKAEYGHSKDTVGRDLETMRAAGITAVDSSGNWSVVGQDVAKAKDEAASLAMRSAPAKPATPPKPAKPPMSSPSDAELIAFFKKRPGPATVCMDELVGPRDTHQNARQTTYSKLHRLAKNGFLVITSERPLGYSVPGAATKAPETAAPVRAEERGTVQRSSVPRSRFEDLLEKAEAWRREAAEADEAKDAGRAAAARSIIRRIAAEMEGCEA